MQSSQVTSQADAAVLEPLNPFLGGVPSAAAGPEISDVENEPTTSGTHHLVRSLDWKDAFWVVSGVPAGVLFTIGGVYAAIGHPAWMIWVASIGMGLIQSFTYAEISCLYPHKSGGASVYGALGWVGYNKYLAPVSVWANWLAWSPMLALGTGLGASYMLSALFPADAVINSWSLTLLSLDFIKPGLHLRINAVFIIATVFLLLTFALQHAGAAKAAKTQRILGVACLTPLLIVGLVPLITGDVLSRNLVPLLPMVHDAAGAPVTAAWTLATVIGAMGAMFMAGWATYGFETAVCYTREFKNPSTDTPKAILSSGILCLIVMTLVPLAFQGVLGAAGMMDPKIIDGTGVGSALAHLVGGGPLIFNLVIAMLVLSVLLIVMTSMMGSSRTLYQASYDGWLPRYLSRVNEHGAPTAAMWTDLIFNLILLLMSDYLAVLLMSNVCYMIFVFLNLQAGWIHRIDRPTWARPYRCPNWLLVLGALCGYVNLAFMGAAADLVGGPGTLRNGLIAALMIIPVFCFRHLYQDKGVFPPSMAADMKLTNAGGPGGQRAGVLPYLAIAVAVALVWGCHTIAQHTFAK